MDIPSKTKVQPEVDFKATTKLRILKDIHTKVNHEVLRDVP